MFFFSNYTVERQKACIGDKSGFLMKYNIISSVHVRNKVCLCPHNKSKNRFSDQSPVQTPDRYFNALPPSHMNYTSMLIKGPSAHCEIWECVRPLKKRKGMKGECREQVGPVLLYEVDVWAVTHLLTCLGGAATADMRVCVCVCVCAPFN